MLVSQWRVNSASTSQLMIAFYGAERVRGRESETMAGTLRRASLQFIKNNHYHHPFYWGGFVLIGLN